MRTVRWISTLLLALSVTGCGLLESPEKQLARAELALASGNYGEAAVALRNVVDRDAANSRARLLLARALFQQGELEAAQITLQAAADEGADAASVADIRARWQLVTGDYQALLDATADPATAFDSTSRTYFRARALQGLQRIPEALALYSGLLAGQRPDSPDLHLRIAQGHAFHGRASLAQASLDAALSLPLPAGEPPSVAEAWLLQAALLQQKGDLAAAREAHGRAIAAAPGELGALQLGPLLASSMEMALRAGDVAKARTYREQVHQLLPQSPLAQVVSAQLQIHEGKPTAAAGDLQLLLQRQPEDVAARGLLVAAHLFTGTIEQALREATRLASSAPSGAGELRRLEQLIGTASEQPVQSVERALAVTAALAALGQPALARLHVEQALEKHPDAMVLAVARVQLEMQNGRVQQALQLAQQLRSAHPDERSVAVLLAEAQAASGDHAAAAAGYEALWRSEPTGPLTLVLVQTRRQAGVADPDAPLRQWLQDHPQDEAARLQLATTLQQAGQHAAASRELQRLLGTLPQDHPLRPVALNNLAVVYSELGDARALETARSAHDAAPDVPAIQDTYGWLLFQHDRLREALPLLESAARRSPTSHEVRYHHAAALARSGDKDSARLLLQDILQAPEDFDGKREAEQLLGTL